MKLGGDLFALVMNPSATEASGPDMLTSLLKIWPDMKQC